MKSFAEFAESTKVNEGYEDHHLFPDYMQKILKRSEQSPQEKAKNAARAVAARANAKPVDRKAEPYKPLGGRDEKSGRSYSEEVDLDEAASPAARFNQKVKQAQASHEAGDHKKAKYHLDAARNFMLGINSNDHSKIKDSYPQYKKLRDLHTEEVVAEGLGKTIKRGMAGWGAFDKDKPADVVKRVRGQDTDTLKGLSNRGSTGKGSPAELQQKAISRELKKRGEQGVAEGAPIVVAQAPIDVRNPKKAPQPYRNQGDIVPDTKPPSTEKRGVKGRPGQRPMPEHVVAEESELGDLAHPLVTKHRFLVTYSDPNHTMVSKRKEKQQKHLLVPGSDKKGSTIFKGDAEPLVKKYMNKQGLRVHEVEHVGMVTKRSGK